MYRIQRKTHSKSSTYNGDFNNRILYETSCYTNDWKKPMMNTNWNVRPIKCILCVYDGLNLLTRRGDIILTCDVMKRYIIIHRKRRCRLNKTDFISYTLCCIMRERNGQPSCQEVFRTTLSVLRLFKNTHCNRHQTRISSRR